MCLLFVLYVRNCASHICLHCSCIHVQNLSTDPAISPSIYQCICAILSVSESSIYLYIHRLLSIWIYLSSWLYLKHNNRAKPIYPSIYVLTFLLFAIYIYISVSLSMSKLLSIYLSVCLSACLSACLPGWLAVCLSFFLSFFLSFLSIVNCQPFSFNYCCTFPSHGVRLWIPSNFIPWHQFGKALGICTHRCMQWMVHCTIQSVFAVWEACPLGDACCGLSSRCQGCWVCPDTTWVTMSCICGMNRNHFHERVGATATTSLLWQMEPAPLRSLKRHRDSAAGATEKELSELDIVAPSKPAVNKDSNWHPPFSIENRSINGQFFSKVFRDSRDSCWGSDLGNLTMTWLDEGFPLPCWFTRV